MKYILARLAVRGYETRNMKGIKIMGLIRAGAGALGGTLADQWKEFFYCDALTNDVLMRRGQKQITGRSSNTKGNDNIITNGSGIAVADGQCMMIVEQGKIVEVCAEPGEFVYDSSTEPSIFSGKLGDSIKQTFRTIGKRFTYGGDPGKDQRVYYFNTKEIIDNKFGTPNPIIFEVTNKRIGLSRTVQVRCNGVYTYVISDPLLFYTRLCGNVTEEFTRDQIDDQLRVEFVDALQPALGALAELELRPAQLPAKANELKAAMNDALKQEWAENRKDCAQPHNADRRGYEEDQRDRGCGKRRLKSVYNGGQNDQCHRRCNADRRRKRRRCDDRLYGYGNGRHGRSGRFRRGSEYLCRRRCAGTTGSAESARTAVCRCVEMLLRCDLDG